MPLPETGLFHVCDSISVYYVALNEFLVSFSKNEIWIANLGLAVGTFGRAVRGNRYTESFIGTLGHPYCSVISHRDSFIFKATGRLALLLLNVSKSVSAFIKPIDLEGKLSVRLSDICLDGSSCHASSIGDIKLIVHWRLGEHICSVQSITEMSILEGFCQSIRCQHSVRQVSSKDITQCQETSVAITSDRAVGVWRASVSESQACYRRSYSAQDCLLFSYCPAWTVRITEAEKHSLPHWVGL